MKQWEDRPIEEANLFNPAFCGDLFMRSIKNYNENAQNIFPYPLIFLILPIVLLRRTREMISPNTQKPLHVWLQNNQSVRLEFAENAKNLVPITNEALNFLMQLNLVLVNDNAGLVLKRLPKPINKEQGDEEIRDCQRKAEIVGRWFARAGSPANIYTMWGIKP